MKHRNRMRLILVRDNQLLKAANKISPRLRKDFQKISHSGMAYYPNGVPRSSIPSLMLPITEEVLKNRKKKIKMVIKNGILVKL